MTTLEIFEKVNLLTPIEQRRFFNYLEDSIYELRILYGNSIFYQGFSRLMECPADFSTNYKNYFEMQSNGFVPVRDAQFADNKKYEKTEEKDTLINIPPPKALDDDIVIKPLYHLAIVDNILYLAGCGDGYKSEFIRKSDAADKENWREKSNDGRIRRMRW